MWLFVNPIQARTKPRHARFYLPFTSASLEFFIIHCSLAKSQFTFSDFAVSQIFLKFWLLFFNSTLCSATWFVVDLVNQLFCPVTPVKRLSTCNSLKLHTSSTAIRSVFWFYNTKLIFLQRFWEFKEERKVRKCSYLRKKRRKCVVRGQKKCPKPLLF